MAKENTGLEFLESPDALANKIGEVQPFYDKHKQTILKVGGAIAGIVLLFAGYKFYTASQDTEGQAVLYKSWYQVEGDSLDVALKGKGSQPGLLTVADDYGSSDAGNLASFLAGATLLKQGKYDEAIERLKSFSSSDLLVQARAYALIGDAYTEKNATEEAIEYYKKAVDYKPNQFFTPTYLIKLGIAQEKAKQYKDAAGSYDTIIENYPNSAEYITAKKYKAQVEDLVSE